MFDNEKMREKALLLLDPNSGYTQEDFNKEFSIHTIVSEPNVYNKLTVQIKNSSNNPNPEFATDGASGFDLRANLSEDVVIKPSKYTLIKTGIYIEMPENMEMTIRSRSGLASKYGVCVLNGIGTIDSDYRGEIGVLLINHGETDFIVKNGDRIAQGVLSNVIGKSLVHFKNVDEITDNTKRSSGGFGSTGTK